MGAYRSSGDRPELPSFSRRLRGPAAWGGIGCVLALLFPVLGYMAALLTLEYNARYHWFVLPPYMTRSLVPGVPISGAVLALTLGYVVVLYGIYAVVYALVYRMVGISPYTPLDWEVRERSTRRVSRVRTSQLIGVLGFLLAVVGGIALVHLNLAQGWVDIPRSWRVRGPFPYAGVDLFVVLLLWAVLWAFWSLLQGLLSALFYSKDKSEDRRKGGKR